MLITKTISVKGIRPFSIQLANYGGIKTSYKPKRKERFRVSLNLPTYTNIATDENRKIRNRGLA